MSSSTSGNSRAVQSVAGVIAHPERHHKQFWTAGIMLVAAIIVYFAFGLLALVGLAVVGGVATHYTRKSLRSRRQGELR